MLSILALAHLNCDWVCGLSLKQVHGELEGRGMTLSFWLRKQYTGRTDTIYAGMDSTHLACGIVHSRSHWQWCVLLAISSNSKLTISQHISPSRIVSNLVFHLFLSRTSFLFFGWPGFIWLSAFERDGHQGQILVVCFPFSNFFLICVGYSVSESRSTSLHTQVTSDHPLLSICDLSSFVLDNISICNVPYGNSGIQIIKRHFTYQHAIISMLM